MFAETHATDSYQNVLLSLIQYPTFVQRVHAGQSTKAERIESTDAERSLWPNRLTIVSHAFKRSRFLDLHLPAIRPPVQAVEFTGLNPPFNQDKLAEIVEGDRLRGFGAWKDDLYGNGDLLSGKRLQRGWNERLFMDQVPGQEDLWSAADQQMLAALVRGEAGAMWPGTEHSSGA